MFSGKLLGVALVVLASAACSKGDPDAPTPAAKLGAEIAPTRDGRHVESLAKLRKDPRVTLPSTLPTKGIAWMRPGGQVLLDVDGSTLTYVTQNAPHIVPLGPSDVTRLWAQAEDVWRDPIPTLPGAGLAGGSGSGVEVLAFVDGDDAYYLPNAANAPPSSSAKKLIDELAKVMPVVKPEPTPVPP